MSKRVYITGCTDSLLWYNEHVGEEFSAFKVEFDHLTGTKLYWVRATDGYSNFIYEKDCEEV